MVLVIRVIIVITIYVQENDFGVRLSPCLQRIERVIATPCASTFLPCGVFPGFDASEKDGEGVRKVGEGGDMGVIEKLYSR